MIIDDIREASLEARKARTETATFLVTLLSEASRVGKDNGNRDPSDEEVISVLKKFKAGIEEIKNIYVGKGGFKQSIDRANIELAVLEKFLPHQLSKGSLTAIIKGIIKYHDIKDSSGTGIIMRDLKTQAGGYYDGKLAASVIKEILL